MYRFKKLRILLTNIFKITSLETSLNLLKVDIMVDYNLKRNLGKTNLMHI